MMDKGSAVKYYEEFRSSDQDFDNFIIQIIRFSVKKN